MSLYKEGFGEIKTFSFTLDAGENSLAEKASLPARVGGLVFKSISQQDLQIYGPNQTVAEAMILPANLMFDPGVYDWKDPEVLIQGTGDVDGFYIT